MKSLVTGAHGFIGSHLTEELLREGLSVRALVSPWGSLENLKHVLEHPDLEIIRADITEAGSLEGVCKDIEVVYHAAAKVADWGAEAGFVKTNVQGTENLLREAERAGVRRFVLVSSVAIHRYGGFRQADPRVLPLDGDINAYARSKVAAEERVQAAGLEHVIIRPGLWPFGARDPNFKRVVGAMRGFGVPLVNGGEAVINTAYSSNLVYGLRLAGTVPQAANKVYVIADEGMPSWRELFGELANILNVKPSRLNLPTALARPLGDAVETLWSPFPGLEPPLTRYQARLMLNDIHFSLEAAKTELGYSPRVSWQEGLREAVAAL